MESFITSEIMEEVLANPPRSLNEIKAELLFLDGAYILHSKEGNTSRYKYLSSATLRKAFSEIAVDSGWLDPSVIRWGSNQSGDWAIKFIPPQIYDIDCSNLGMLKIPLPAMVFMGNGTEYWVWALDTQEFIPDARPFCVPLPNVYAEWGKICWGNNSPPNCSNQTIQKAWELFISSPFNSHLSNGKSRSQPEDVRKKLLTLHSKKARKYPVSDLTELHKTSTINQLVTAITYDSAD